MKQIELKISGHTYNLEFEDEFYDYIKNDLDRINKDDKQLKVMLEVLLSKSYDNYQNNKKLEEILKKFDF